MKLSNKETNYDIDTYGACSSLASPTVSVADTFSPGTRSYRWFGGRSEGGGNRHDCRCRWDCVNLHCSAVTEAPCAPRLCSKDRLRSPSGPSSTWLCPCVSLGTLGQEGGRKTSGFGRDYSRAEPHARRLYDSSALVEDRAELVS